MDEEEKEGEGKKYIIEGWKYKSQLLFGPNATLSRHII